MTLLHFTRPNLSTRFKLGLHLISLAIFVFGTTSVSFGQTLVDIGYRMPTPSVFEGKSPKQVASIDTASECERLLYREKGLRGGGLYQQAYDTIRHYIELCANEQGAYGGFISADGDNSFRNGDSTQPKASERRNSSKPEYSGLLQLPLMRLFCAAQNE